MVFWDGRSGSYIVKSDCQFNGFCWFLMSVFAYINDVVDHSGGDGGVCNVQSVILVMVVDVLVVTVEVI